MSWMKQQIEKIYTYINIFFFFWAQDGLPYALAFPMQTLLVVHKQQDDYVNQGQSFFFLLVSSAAEFIYFHAGG